MRLWGAGGGCFRCPLAAHVSIRAAPLQDVIRRMTTVDSGHGGFPLMQDGGGIGGEPIKITVGKGTLVKL